MLYFLDENGTDLSLSLFTSFDLPKTDGESHMSLSIAWSRPNENGSQSIAFSDSCGYITLVNLNDELIRSFKAHGFESWIVTYNYWEPNILYTGTFIISITNYTAHFLFIYNLYFSRYLNNILNFRW